MAVIFPTPFGYTLNPNKQSELLQGMLNIENTEGVTTGRLTKDNLISYSQKQFFAADPNSAVATYLLNNYEKLAGIDNSDSALTASDVVDRRKNLPAAPTPTNNGTQQTPVPVFYPFPIYNPGQSFPGSQGQGTPQNISQMFMMLMGQLMQMLQSMF